jgi:hypothetical protein
MGRTVEYCSTRVQTAGKSSSAHILLYNDIRLTISGGSKKQALIDSIIGFVRPSEPYVAKFIYFLTAF